MLQEADIAIAPLAITPDRERVVDFSEPFLSLDTPVTHKKVPKQLSDTFSFLKPLSKEIWVSETLDDFYTRQEVSLLQHKQQS